MNRFRLVTRYGVTLGLGAVLSLGALAGTAAASEGTPPADGAGRTERICNNADRIESAITKRIATIEGRIGKLTQARDRASNAGKTELVARIDGAITKANEHLANAQNRLAQFQGWVDTNCAA
jgi:hypothetical protein